MKLSIRGSDWYRTDELIVTTRLASGNASYGVVELRLESMRGSQGFFPASPGSLVGKIYTSSGRAVLFDVGPDLLTTSLNDRTLETTDVRL